MISGFRKRQFESGAVSDSSATARVKLTQGQYALVDAEDFERISAHKWQAVWRENTQSFYAYRTEGRGASQVSISMASEVLGLSPGQIADHLHHDTLDNRKSQLSPTDASGNAKNKRMFRRARKNKNNTSGHTGVYWRPKRNKWNVEANCKYVGSYNTKEEAIAAREKATENRRIRPHGNPRIR